MDQNAESRLKSFAVEGVLHCPSCYGLLSDSEMGFVCQGCGIQYASVKGVPALCNPSLLEYAKTAEADDAENRFKNWFKRWPNFYMLCVRIVTPVLFSGLTVKRFLKRFPADGSKKILNVGSGPTRLHPDCLNVDLFPFVHVDVLADASKLPFADSTFDVVCSEQVIEHVPDGKAMAQELIRITKPGGLIYLAAPFMYPLHPSPKDYTRWTVDGYLAVLEPAKLVEQGVLAGPTSGFLSITANWLAIIFSFGIKPLRKVFHYGFMIILSPIKLLDYLYATLPGGEEIAKAMYVVVQK